MPGEECVLCCALRGRPRSPPAKTITTKTKQKNNQLGFRSTRVAGGRLLHNGVALMLRGVNRHEWHERWGERSVVVVIG